LILEQKNLKFPEKFCLKKILKFFQFGTIFVAVISL